MNSRSPFKSKKYLAAFIIAAFTLFIFGGVSMARKSGAEPAEPGTKKTALFEYDNQKKEVIAPLASAKDYFKMKFVSATMDQPLYWPDEEAFLKVVFPYHAGNEVTVKVQKKDSTHEEIGKFKHDEAGILVHKILSGKEKKLEAGEYSVSVETADKKIFEYTTFTVVEGHLGAVSFSFEFQQLTNAEALKEVNGGWFLGNASGVGNRWGNGLNVKNQVRVLNQPFSGKASVKSRCHLPGCNGCEAGPEKEVVIKEGLLQTVLEVGGHSGPFELEVITDKGSVKNLFAKSGHVERQTSLVTGGMTNIFYATLAPYEGTEQVSGRDIYIEKKAPNDADALYLNRPVASNSGDIDIEVKKRINKVKAYQISINDKGEFVTTELKLAAELKKGDTIKAACAAPYSMIAIAGFIDNETALKDDNKKKDDDKSKEKYYEAWAMIFTPARVEIDISAPAAAAPLSKQKIKLRAADRVSGKGIKAHGIIEVFDNRVASKSAKEPLDSSIGDSFRDASAQIASWRDWTGYNEFDETEMLTEDSAVSRNFIAPPSMSDVPGGAAPAPKMEFSKAMSVAGAPKKRAMAMPQELSQPEPGPQGGAEGVTEAVREGEKKVIYCAAVVTDSNGDAEIEAELPPQTGRCKIRFIAIDKFDYREKTQDIDCGKKSFVEASVNTLLVPGAKLAMKASVVKSSGEKLTLKISGACLDKDQTFDIKDNTADIDFNVVGRNYGKLSLVLEGDGKVADRREFQVSNISAMPVTFSDVIISDGAPIKLEKAGSIAIYSNPARLMTNIIANINTTMYSWFGHAEAVSASIAIRAMLLRAVADNLISDEGFRDKLILDLKKSVKDFNEKFYDEKTGLVYPYPGVPANLNFTAWAAKNISTAVTAISGIETLKAELAEQCDTLSNMLEKMIAELAKQKVSLHETAFFDAGTKDDFIPVEIDGKIIYKAPSDDAVINFFSTKFLPAVDMPKLGRADRTAAFIKAYDTYRFLRAFERTGMLYYTLINMKAMLKKEDRNFFKLFNEVSKGLVNTNEPGLIQGPAMLGGVYSAPQTFVKYIDLLVEMTRQKRISKDAAVEITVNGKTEKIIVSDTPYIVKADGADVAVKMPEFAAVRVDREHEINIYDHLEKTPFFKLASDKASYAIGEEGALTVTLDGKLDASEYYALIAAPSNLTIRQSEDMLSDYRGQVLYGQKASGAVKMQFVAVPFRGSKNLTVSVEGAFKGESEGFVCVRHISNPEKIVTLKTDKITVK